MNTSCQNNSADDFISKVVTCCNFYNCSCHCNDIAEWQYTHSEKGVPYAVPALNNRHTPEPFNGDPQKAKVVFISSNPSIRLNENTPRSGDAIAHICDFFINRFNISKKYVEHIIPFKYYALDVNGKRLGGPVTYWKNAAKIARILRNVGLDECLLTEVVKCKTRKEDKNYVTDAVGEECMDKFFSDFMDMLNYEKRNEKDKSIIFIVVGTFAREQINKWIDRHSLPLGKILNGDGLVNWKWGDLNITLLSTRHLSWQWFDIYAEFDDQENFLDYKPLVFPNISTNTLNKI